MRIKSHRPQLLAGVACLMLAAATLPFASPAQATWSAPTWRATWDRHDYSLLNPNDVGIEGSAMTSDGTTFLSTESSRSRLKVIDMNSATDTSTHAVTHTVSISGCPKAVAIDPTNSFAYITNPCTNSVWKVDMATWVATEIVTPVCTSGALKNIEISPANNYVTASCANFWSNAGSQLHIIRLSDLSMTDISPADTAPAIRMAINSAGTTVYTASKWGGSGIVTAYALSDGSAQFSIDTVPSAGDGITNIALNGDGTVLYIVNYNGSVAAWTDLGTTPRKLWEVQMSATVTNTVMLYSISPFVVDNTNHLGYFVHGSGSMNSGFQVIDLYDGNFLFDVATEETWASSSVLSADGSTLVISGSRDSNFVVYNVGLGSSPHTTTTTTTATTVAPTTTAAATTTLAVTTTAGGVTTTVDNRGTIKHETGETLAVAGTGTASNLFAVITLLAIGAGLILTARRRPAA